MCKILVHFSTWKKQKYNNALEIYNILLCSVEYVKFHLFYSTLVENTLAPILD